MEFFTGLPTVAAASATEKQAAEILLEQLRIRRVAETDPSAPWQIRFYETSAISLPDAYTVSRTDRTFIFSAKSLRGFIYAIGLFLRKTEYKNGGILLVKDISGVYAPAKTVRGHQLGYRPLSNTYDKWTAADFYNYTLELAFFGMNTVEHIPMRNGESERNILMPTDEQTLLTAVSADIHKLGLLVSLWMPNGEATTEEALANREKIFAETPYVDAVFIPGSDPGDLPANELFARGRAISEILKRYHPNAKLYISAQAPHSAPGWGEDFLREAERADFLDGLIMGPNHAFDIETLRRRMPRRLPLRFYPDLTHNLRCEYPVHFETDDWHYAFCATLSRESINPRPTEYARLHALTSPYTVGSVSYSEGVNDDVNKAVWSALEWEPAIPVREILEDYARLYLPGVEVKTAVDALIGLERNWIGAPETNPEIEHTLSLWESINSPALANNWRFVQSLFRARCDAFIRQKILFENARIEEAKPLLIKGALHEADACLTQPLPAETAALRRQLDTDADKLFSLIGLQLSTEKHHAAGWERGATLNTIDLPVTDLPWLRNRIAQARRLPTDAAAKLFGRILRRNSVKPDEFYFSFSLFPLSALGAEQAPEHYMNVLADRREQNDGNLPVCLFKLFDHFALYCRRGGFLPDTDYTLRVVYKNKKNPDATKHKITANGRLIYEGPPFGGCINRDFTDMFLPEGFAAVDYSLPADVFENGCLFLSITEPTQGFETAEFFILREDDDSDDINFS